MNTAPFKGRGATFNPPNRFEMLHYAADPELPPEDRPAPSTIFIRDDTQSIISHNDSPDTGFTASVNPYRGCEHGCIYCYARPTHEYAGFSSGLDFESKILVKMHAPELLRKELSKRSWKPQVVAMSGVTDCYQPAERHFQLTRQCLEVFAECRNPVSVISKNHLVTRDIELFKEMTRWNGITVFISITTLDSSLASLLEPRAARPSYRLDAVRQLAEAGIPVGVMMAPVIPVLTESEMPAILKAAAEAGAQTAGYVMLRLPHAVKHLFENWLKTHYPDKAEAVLARIRSIRSGKLNDSEFGTRMRGSGVFAEQIKQVFDVCCRREKLKEQRIELSTSHFRKPLGAQLSLFPDL